MDFKKKSTKTILGVIGVGCLILVSVFFYNRTGQQKLNYSLNYLLEQTLNFRYVPKNESLSNFETDLSGYWWVLLDEVATNKITSDTRFALADEADLIAYKKIFQKKLSLVGELEGFYLYRGEITMGENSICEETPCNVEIFMKPDQKNLYVGISKI